MKRISIFALFFLLTVVMTAYAEDEKSQSIPARAKVSTWYVGETSYGDGGASDVQGLAASLKIAGFSFGYEGRKYAWSDTSELDFGNGKDDPWEKLHRFTLGYEHMGMINEEWGYLGAVTLTSAFEDQMDNSYGAAVRGGFTYKYDDNWSGMIGARVFKNHIRTSAMPFIGISYEDYDENGEGTFFSIGAPSLEFGYAFDDTAKVRFNGNFDSRTYRLSDESSVVERGYVQTNSAVMGLYYDAQPFQGLSFSVGPELHLLRELKFYNNNGDRQGSVERQNNGLGFRVDASYKF